MITVWLLVIGIGPATTISVPNIVSEIECDRLAARFSTTAGQTPAHRCIDYKVPFREAANYNITVQEK